METNETKKPIDKDKFRVRIVQDEDPMNPRKEWDNMSIMLCGHKQYDLGDRDAPQHLIERCRNWGEVAKALIQEEKAVAIIPLYLYDHSGITMRTSSFPCRWDSGQVGLIYTTKAKLREMGHTWKNITKKRKEQILEWLENDVKTYDQYLTGEVFGFAVEEKIVYSSEGRPDKEVWETIDSCYGFFGGDHKESGMQDNYQEYLDAGCEVIYE